MPEVNSRKAQLARDVFGGFVRPMESVDDQSLGTTAATVSGMAQGSNEESSVGEGQASIVARPQLKRQHSLELRKKVTTMLFEHDKGAIAMGRGAANSVTSSSGAEPNGLSALQLQLFRVMGAELRSESRRIVSLVKTRALQQQARRAQRAVRRERG